MYKKSCKLLCKKAVVSQGLVLKVSSDRSLKDSSCDQKRVKKSKKKFPKYQGSVMQLSLIRPSMRCLGPRKKNHKKSRRCLLGLKYHSKEKSNKHAISSDVGPSISGKEHLRSSLMKHDAEGETINRTDQNCAVLATATQVENMSQCLMVKELEAGHACSLQDDKRDEMHNTVVTRGLEETVGTFLINIFLSDLVGTPHRVCVQHLCSFIIFVLGCAR